jgi:hypothetical protein
MAPDAASASVPVARAAVAPPTVPQGRVGAPATDADVKDGLLSEIRKSKTVFYNTVVAQAQKIEVSGDRVLFTFSPSQRTLRDMFEQNRSWLETVVQQVAGRQISVVSAHSEAGAVALPSADTQAKADRKTALKEQALADAGVQALLEVFPAEIRDVEEM